MTDTSSSEAQYTPDDHPTVSTGRVAALFVNLGTPDAPTAKAVRTYLAEFLSDRRVVDLPRALWLPILHGVILNVRPAATARNYSKIWRSESNESPLRYYTRAQADGVRKLFGDGPLIDWAMRYGRPSIADRLTALQNAGADRILIIPLYPQYSATTTGSVVDAVGDALKSMRWQPAIRIAPPFHDEPGYIEALAATATRQLKALKMPPERVILSFHGIPERYFKAGDPYHCHCQKTARLLREHMGWTAEFAPLAFQSKFGREKWLEPATDEMINSLGESGVKRIAVMTPAFVSDCIETLEEIAIVGKESFLSAGGEDLNLIECLNDTPEMLAFLKALTERELSGWR